MNYTTSELWLGFVLCISLLLFFKLKSCPLPPFFFSKNFSEDVLGWKESFDLLLSSKSELCLLCLSVDGTRVAHGYPCAAEPA